MLLIGVPLWAVPAGSVSDRRVAMVPNHGSWMISMSVSLSPWRRA